MMDEDENAFRNKKPVKLAALVEGMDMPGSPFLAFLNLETGEIVEVLEEYLETMEKVEGDELEEFMEDEEMKTAYDVLIDHCERYLALPGRYEIDEYEIMRDFCESLEDDELSEALCRAIRGRGAYRKFKDGIYEHGIAEDWYKFREEAFKEIAKNWCIYNRISCIG